MRLRKLIVRQLYLLSFPFFHVVAYSKNGWTDFHDLYLKQRGFTQGCAFRGFRWEKKMFRISKPDKTPKKWAWLGSFKPNLRKIEFSISSKPRPPFRDSTTPKIRSGNSRELLSSRWEFLRVYSISNFSYFLLWIVKSRSHENSFPPFCIGLTRYIAITNLSIIAVFVEYLRQFLIDLHQIYRHGNVPKNTSPCIFPAF